MEQKKRIGIIGLGKMGGRVSKNLSEKGFDLIGFDIGLSGKKEYCQAAIKESISKLAGSLKAPRVIIIFVPSKEVDSVIEELKKTVEKGDIIIDSGNSFYEDSIRHYDELKKQGIHFMDIGMSGGVSGARNGACLMIGGDKELFCMLEYLFDAMSKDGSYKYLGKAGNGHLVKGYHNLVEYGYLQSLAEGLESVSTLSDINIRDVCEIWNKGSIVESRIVGWCREALEKNPSLEGISGSVTGQTHEEMKKLKDIAEGKGVNVNCCEEAIRARARSKTHPSLSGKIINAVRNVFGGHEEWKK